VTISSDDPPFFHTSLKREYELASDTFGFTDEEINELTRTSIEAAFVDEETRKVLFARL
jgi:adenosine deaminase